MPVYRLEQQMLLPAELSQCIFSFNSYNIKEINVNLEINRLKLICQDYNQQIVGIRS